MVSTPGPFILEEDHPWGSAVFIRKIHPHPVLGCPFLLGLIDHLESGFITVDISAAQEFFPHQVIDRLQVPFCAQDDPVGHGLC